VRLASFNRGVVRRAGVPRVFLACLLGSPPASCKSGFFSDAQSSSSGSHVRFVVCRAGMMLNGVSVT
jgi:hypothetical protein